MKIPVENPHQLHAEAVAGGAQGDPVWIRMQTVFPDLQAHSPQSRERQLAPTHVLRDGDILAIQ